MRTHFTIMKPDGSKTAAEVEWPAAPSFKQIKALVGPLIDNEPLEHVSVLHDGKRADLFVSEYGALNLTTRPPLPRNEAATAIYRNYWLTHNPGTAPETLPAIYGTAILFDRIVWT